VPFTSYRSSFDPETLAVLQAAFDSAWQELQTSGNRLASDADREAARARLAKRIVAAAAAGERDPAVLKLAALQGLRDSRPPRAGGRRDPGPRQTRRSDRYR
jgi:hypothetical protein